MVPQCFAPTSQITLVSHSLISLLAGYIQGTWRIRERPITQDKPHAPEESTSAQQPVHSRLTRSANSITQSFVFLQLSLFFYTSSESSIYHPRSLPESSFCRDLVIALTTLEKTVSDPTSLRVPFGSVWMVLELNGKYITPFLNHQRTDPAHPTKAHTPESEPSQS